MFKQINNRDGSCIWDNVFFQEPEVISKSSFPIASEQIFKVWALTGWYWMNSYKNSLTSAAPWIAFQCIHILPHSMSVEVKSFFCSWPGRKNKSRCQELRAGARRRKGRQHWQSPEESAPICLVCLSNVLSQDQTPCPSTNALSETQQLCRGSLRKQQESRISSQAVGIPINVSVTKAAVYL